MGDLRSFFAAGKTAPIGNTRYPSGYGLTQRRHPAVPPDTTLSPRPFPSGPTALGLQLLLSRPTQPSPRTAGKIRLVRKSGDPENIVRPGNPPQLENQPARNIVRPENQPARNIVRPENPPARNIVRPEIRRPGTSFARKSASPGKSAGPTHVPAVYRRPPFIPPGTRPVGFVPLRSPSPARFTPLSPRRNTCRASPLPPNGMPHEPRRGRPVQICKPDRMPRQKERQPAGAAALRQSDSGPIICC